MNNWQRLFVAIWLLLIVGMGTFPPWTYRFTYDNHGLRSHGYAPLWAPGVPTIRPPLRPSSGRDAFLVAVRSPEYWQADLDIVRLLVQWVVVGFAMGALVWAFRDAHQPATKHQEPNSNSAPER